MLKFTSVLAAAGFAMLPLASQAASSSVPTLGDVLKASGIQANGYIDFGTTYNNAGLNGLSGIGGINAANNLGFRLNQVGLAVTTALSDHFSGTLDLLAGGDASAVSGDSGAGGVAAKDIVLKQAYVQYTDGGLTVMGGRYVTLAGMEVINSSQNQNATRSLLFMQLQPLTHTGVRASYSINKMITLTGGFNNAASAANSVFDNNKQKTLELQVAVTPFDGFNNALTFYRGTENVGVPDGKPFLIDLVSSLQITKALSVGLNYDFRALQNTSGVGLAGSDRRDHGVALYSRFQLCNNFAVGGRAEFLESSYNNANRTTQYEYTLTTDYAVSKNFSVLTDLRYDMNAGTLANATGVILAGPAGAPLNSIGSTGGIDAASVTVKGIYRF